MLKKLLIIIGISAVAFSASAQDAVYLDKVVGLNADGTGIIAGEPIEFKINFRVQSSPINAFTTGLRIYSPDGATWKPATQTINPDLPLFLDGGIFSNYLSVTGSGADTIGFGGFSIFTGGVPVGYDGWVHTNYTMVSNDDIGKTLCLDSSYYPPSGIWLWTTDAGPVTPSWDGPHCYEIADCCTGITGDFNYDGSLNIADLTSFVDWLHRGTGAAPPCYKEANIDGLNLAGSDVNVADLITLVRYLFLDGPPPVDCP